MTYLAIFTHVVLDRIRPFSDFYNEENGIINWRFVPELLVWIFQISYIVEEIREVNF